MAPKDMMLGMDTGEIAAMLLNHLPVGYTVLDEDYRVLYASNHMLAMRGLPREKVVGEICYNLAAGGQRCETCAVAAARESGCRAHLVRKDILPNGGICYIDNYAVPLPAQGPGGQQLYMEILIDRTAQMQMAEQNREEFIQLIANLSAMLEAKDEYTAQHSDNVRQLAVRLAQQMQLSPAEVERVEVAAALHDVGKVLLDYRIINKPGPLTAEEFAQVKTHSRHSYDILSGLSRFSGVQQAVLYHHERYDGTGYPGGLAGKDIPLEARIIAVADSYDAMVSDRSYRKAMSHGKAMQELNRCSGTQFDPDVVRTFSRLGQKVPPPPQTRRTPSGYLERTLYELPPQQLSPRAPEVPVPQELLLQAILENTPVAYVLTDANNKVRYASKTYLQLMGKSWQQVAGKACHLAAGCKGRCKNCPVGQAQRTQKLASAQVAQMVHGQQRYWDCYAAPHLENGKLAHMMVVILDRTEERQLEEQLEKDFHSLLNMLTQLLSRSDPYAYNKSAYMRRVCALLARQLNLSPGQCEEIDLAAMLCDVGMIAIADQDDEDGALYRAHPEIACRMLGGLSRFAGAHNIIRHHHSHYNGGGYPGQLRGEELPIGSRLLFLAHSFYRKVQSGEQFAMQHLRRYSGTRFDPALVQLFESQMQRLAPLKKELAG